MPSYRLLTIFYVFALVATALGTFGPIGMFIAAMVIGFWAWTHYRPSKKTNLVGWLSASGLIALLAMLLLPALSSVRGAAERSDCMYNLKQVQLACLSYESVNGTMPPAYIADASGKPVHSWRVLILPYFGDPALTALYAKYNLNEPWNGPNNSRLAQSTPDVFRCPGHSDDKAVTAGETHYVAVVGPDTGWPGSKGRPIKQITDGMSMTIMVIEASGLGINWMEPRDVSLDEAIELLTTKPRSGHAHVDDEFLTRIYYETSSRNVVWCDGHVRWMEQLKDAELAKSYLTATGGEREMLLRKYGYDKYKGPISWPRMEKYVEPKSTIFIKWGVVWSLAVFVMLALLPARWVGRCRSIVEPSTNQEQDAGVSDVAAANAIT
jgi:prepilin-type processing-associated H-X9-DG protein